MLAHRAETTQIIVYFSGVLPISILQFQVAMPFLNNLLLAHGQWSIPKQRGNLWTGIEYWN